MPKINRTHHINAEYTTAEVLTLIKNDLFQYGVSVEIADILLINGIATVDIEREELQPMPPEEPAYVPTPEDAFDPQTIRSRSHRT